ncbi:MAG: hypothetical protein IPK58_22135 [Acidobacteria bacterium]|nr:hypothetical protein [Acidobacteriota bacterium]
MGNFSNGNESIEYQRKYCDNCRNWRKREDETVAGCPVWDAEIGYLTAPGNRHWFIPYIGSEGFIERNLECRMFEQKEQT